MNRNWFRWKYIIFGYVFLMMGYVINHSERFLIDSGDRVWKHYEPFKWWLLVHGLMAACALFLGPMQFSDRLRLRCAKLHRVVGRVYVAGVLIGSPIGAFIQYRFDEQVGMWRSFTIATMVDALLWTLTTVIALAFALKGKIQQHRQWMTRSYAVAIVGNSEYRQNAKKMREAIVRTNGLEKAADLLEQAFNLSPKPWTSSIG